MQGFSAGETSRLAKIAYANLDYWSRSGFLTAGVLEAKGKGTRRVYSFRDVVALRVASEARRFGVSLQGLRKVQQRLRHYRDLENPLASARLVLIAGKRTDVAHVEIIDSAEKLVSLLEAPGQVSRFMIDLAPLVREVKQGIVVLENERAKRRAKSARRRTRAA